MKKELVDHPKHYGGDVKHETWKCLNAWGLEQDALIMRTTAEAHPQMRQVTIPLLAEFQKAFPLLFDDIVPMAKQSESMKRIR